MGKGARNLSKMGKIVIAVDLQPSARTFFYATVTNSSYVTWALEHAPVHKRDEKG
jgi:phosphopantothenate synthetase